MHTIQHNCDQTSPHEFGKLVEKDFEMKFLFLIAFAAAPIAAHADTPVIEAAEAKANGNVWTFSVSLRHPDSGWDHYADGWEVLAPDGSQLGLRVLAHPHVSEQPFTRSLGGVVIPEGISRVTVRAKCSVDGWTSGPFEVLLGN